MMRDPTACHCVLACVRAAFSVWTGPVYPVRLWLWGVDQIQISDLAKTIHRLNEFELKELSEGQALRDEELKAGFVCDLL